ncbi:hypothetical protein BGX28_006136 [Mortierella sp. GBA30]|nr:hypothetical protein BGX28_006136 [Mortierella sp. GBA30]
MPDSTKDRPADMAPSLIDGYTTTTTQAFAGADGPSLPAFATASALKRRNQSHHQVQNTRSESSHSPLSLPLPLSSRTNSGLSNGYSNGMPPASAPSVLSTGYLEHRRDTFHSLTHLPPSTSLNSLNTPHSTSIPDNNNNISWANHTAGIHVDDHPTPPLASHPPLHQRPHSLSYANQQHTSSLSSLDAEATTRRRRLSTASSSSKHRLGSSSNSNIRSKAPNTPHHTRRFTTLISDQEPDTTYLWGYLLFFCTMVGFTLSMYALVASNYMPMTGNKTLDWIKQDSHYCMLVPVTIPVTVLAVLFNWLGMKLFRHN